MTDEKFLRGGHIPPVRRSVPLDEALRMQREGRGIILPPSRPVPKWKRLIRRLRFR